MDMYQQLFQRRSQEQGNVNHVSMPPLTMQDFTSRPGDFSSLAQNDQPSGTRYVEDLNGFQLPLPPEGGRTRQSSPKKASQNAAAAAAASNTDVSLTGSAPRYTMPWQADYGVANDTSQQQWLNSIPSGSLMLDAGNSAANSKYLATTNVAQNGSSATAQWFRTVPNKTVCCDSEHCEDEFLCSDEDCSESDVCDEVHCDGEVVCMDQGCSKDIVCTDDHCSEAVDPCADSHCHIQTNDGQAEGAAAEALASFGKNMPPSLVLTTGQSLSPAVGTKDTSRWNSNSAFNNDASSDEWQWDDSIWNYHARTPFFNSQAPNGGALHSHLPSFEIPRSLNNNNNSSDNFSSLAPAASFGQPANTFNLDQNLQRQQQDIYTLACHILQCHDPSNSNHHQGPCLADNLNDLMSSGCSLPRNPVGGNQSAAEASFNLGNHSCGAHIDGLEDFVNHLHTDHSSMISQFPQNLNNMPFTSQSLGLCTHQHQHNSPAHDRLPVPGTLHRHAVSGRPAFEPGPGARSTKRRKLSKQSATTPRQYHVSKGSFSEQSDCNGMKPGMQSDTLDSVFSSPCRETESSTTPPDNGEGTQGPIDLLRGEGLKSTDEARPFKCIWQSAPGKLCGSLFVTSEELATHLKDVHVADSQNDPPGSGFVCKWATCLRTEPFQTRAKLRRHLAPHSDYKPIACPECNVRLSSQQALSQHMRIHTGEKPWECDLCDMTFKQQSALTMHRRKHTQDKPLSCETCGKRFAESSNLCKHRRTHMSIGQYVCAACGKDFHRLDQLRRHLRSVHRSNKMGLDQLEKESLRVSDDAGLRLAALMMYKDGQRKTSDSASTSKKRKRAAVKEEQGPAGS